MAAFVEFELLHFYFLICLKVQKCHQVVDGSLAKLGSFGRLGSRLRSSNCDWQVGGSDPEAPSIRDVVGGLENSIGVDIRVASLNDAVGSLDLALGGVGGGVAVVVLSDLILSMVLAVGQSTSGANVGWVVVVSVGGSIGLVGLSVVSGVSGDDVVSSIGSSHSLDDLLGRDDNLLSWNSNLLLLGSDGGRDGFDGSWDNDSSEVDGVSIGNLDGGVSHGESRGIGDGGLGGVGLGDDGVNERGRGLVDREVGGGDAESQGVGNIVDALNDTICIDVAVGSPDDSIGSLVLSLDAVLIGVAVLVLAELVLGVELVGGWGHGLGDGNGLADQVGLGNDRLVDDILLGVDGSGVDLGLANDILGLGDNLLGIDLGLGNNLLGVDLRLGNNLLGIDLRLGNNLLGIDLGLGLDNNLRGNDLLNLRLSNILDRLNGLNGLLLRWLVGDGLGDQLQVLLPGSGDLGGVLNLDWDSSGDPESSLVGDVVDCLDESVGVDVVVVAAHDAVGALLLLTGGAGLRVSELVGSKLILAVVLSQDGDRDDFLSGNRFSCDSFLNGGFLGLLNSWDSCVDDLGVDLRGSDGNRCADDRGVSVLGIGDVLGGIVGVGGGVWKVSVLDIGNDDALLRLDSSNNWNLGLDLDWGGLGLNLNNGRLLLGFDSDGLGSGSLGDGDSRDGLGNRGNWQVGGGYPEPEGVGDVVGGLDDTVGINV